MAKPPSRDDDTSEIEDADRDEMTRIMRDLAKEFLKIAETGSYKGRFVDPLVERTAQAIRKLHAEVVTLRKKSR